MIDFKTILDDIEPSADNEKKVKELSNKIIDIINSTAKKKGFNAEAVLLGSVAKKTWIYSDDYDDVDIDIFIKFPLNTSLEDLKVQGMKLAYNCIEQIGGTYEERYASHPYLSGNIDGYPVDLVPCYDISKATQLKYAVDRTILHTEYVKKSLKVGQEKEVRLLKRFMKMVGTYGSEFKVGGFSGYLCELLIINYGSFLEVLRNVWTDWKPGYQIDLMEYGTSNLFDDPLIVVDPTDSNRNVAAALTLQKMAEFRVAAVNFLENPKTAYFYPKDITLDRRALKVEFDKRDTHSIVITFSAPDIPSDALYPQIKKTENSLVKILETGDFSVLGSDCWTCQGSDDGENLVFILLEMNTWHLPGFRKHFGPKVWDKENGKRFIEKHPESWVEADQWVTLIRREHQDAESLIKGTLTKNGIRNLRVGKHLKKKILDDYHLMNVGDLLIKGKSDEELLKYLYCYLHKYELLFR